MASEYQIWIKVDQDLGFEGEGLRGLVKERPEEKLRLELIERGK